MTGGLSVLRVTVLFLVPAFLLAQATTAAKPSNDDAGSAQHLLQRVERGQRALIALTRINVDQNRLAALESQRTRLLEREAEMTSRQTSGSSSGAPGVESREPALVSIGPGGETRIVPAGSLPANKAEFSRAVSELRRTRETIEQSIDILRSRIAAWEKYLESLGDIAAP